MTGHRTASLLHLAERLGLTVSSAAGRARPTHVPGDSPACICARPDPGAAGCLRCGGDLGPGSTLRGRLRAVIG